MIYVAIGTAVQYPSTPTRSRTTPSRAVALHSLAQTPSRITHSPSKPQSISPSLSPPQTPSHLSRDEWRKAVEELVWCSQEEREEKRAEIEEAMGGVPAIALIRELFDASIGLDDDKKDELTREYGDRLYNSYLTLNMPVL